jgi:hypothetical protein
MRTLKPLGRRKLGLASGLVIALIALATLGLTGPLTTATAQSGARVCGVFAYTQLPDSTNDNKLTWFTLGAAEKIDKEENNCEATEKTYTQPDVKSFRARFPEIPASVEQAKSWVVRGIDKVTCEDFGKYIAHPPKGEPILGWGPYWLYYDVDPCVYMDLKESNSFWFKHL